MYRSTVVHVDHADDVDERLLWVHLVVRQRVTVVSKARVTCCNECRRSLLIGRMVELGDAVAFGGRDVDIADTRISVSCVVVLRRPNALDALYQFPRVFSPLLGTLLTRRTNFM